MHWPADRERRERLRAAGLPCLVLVPDGGRPPADLDPQEEDWVALPASARDLSARSRHLGRRFASAVCLDGALLRTTHRLVPLAPTEVALMVRLLEHRFTLTPQQVLLDGLGIDRRRVRALHRAMHRLRSTIRPLGLDAHPARSRGYFLGLVIPTAPGTA